MKTLLVAAILLFVVVKATNNGPLFLSNEQPELRLDGAEVQTPPLSQLVDTQPVARIAVDGDNFIDNMLGQMETAAKQGGIPVLNQDATPAEACEVDKDWRAKIDTGAFPTKEQQKANKAECAGATWSYPFKYVNVTKR
jgi:hypothetical protein